MSKIMVKFSLKSSDGYIYLRVLEQRSLTKDNGGTHLRVKVFSVPGVLDGESFDLEVGSLSFPELRFMTGSIFLQGCDTLRNPKEVWDTALNFKPRVSTKVALDLVLIVISTWADAVRRGVKPLELVKVNYYEPEIHADNIYEF